MDIPSTLTLSGSDPQGSNLTYRIVAAPAHGSVTNQQSTAIYTPALGFIGNDQFAFVVNDGEFDSAPATVSLQVLAPPSAPSAIVLSTTNISPKAGAGSYLATLSAIDVNPADTHTFQLVANYGDNGLFELKTNQLFGGPDFSASRAGSFSIRLRATDNTGLWVEQDFALTVAAQMQKVVINEIHYNPADNTVREEFIELYNPTKTDIDVSYWQIKGGVQWEIPAGTILRATNYLVIAQDPATISNKHGFAAFGPYSGGLSSEGDTVTLEDASGAQINRVSYDTEFPWPIGADGDGGSMALANPSLDNTLGSSWRTENPPSPGKANQVYTENAAPNIRQVEHAPHTPASTNEVVITAKATDPEGVAAVQLQYQVVAPGFYIPAVLPVAVNSLIANPRLEPTPNPAYTNASSWLTVPMVDTGTDGDEVAGDNVYTAILPRQANRTLVRYRIIVADNLGTSRQAPFEDDPTLNFAYYVYNGIPAYQGTSAEDLQTLPVYTLLSRSQDITQCAAYNGTYQIPQQSGGYAHLARFAFNWPGTMVYDGKVYDNIRYRLHGANGRYQSGKRNWRFRFNQGNYLQARDRQGKAFPRKWTHLTTGKGSNNRLVLTFSLNETLNYFLFNKVGVPAPDTFHFHFRVVSGVNEAPDAYTGDFWGLNWAQEDYDGRFLDHHGLEKGNLYKLINATFSSSLSKDMVAQQRYQGPFAVTNGTDGSTVQKGLLSAQSSEWIRSRVNCSEWYHYHAVCEAVRNYDFWPDANKNAAWYFAPPYDTSNSAYGKLWVLPWDTDSTWGSTWNSGQDLVYYGIFSAASHPDLKIEYANTIREVRDLLFQPDQINPLIDAYAARLRAFIPADLRRWSNAPASSGNYVSMVSETGFTSPALNGGLAAHVQDMKNFMFTGGNKPWWLDRQYVGPGGWITRLDTLATDASIPTKPTITYAGTAGFPATNLVFSSSPFADPQGATSFGAMQWRLAEITPTNSPATNPATLKFEWDAIWDSGELTAFTNKIQIPANATLAGHVYRARVRHKDNTGRWSNWSSPVEFTPNSVDVVSILQKHLVVSEIMYNPPMFDGVKGDEYEFLELHNIGQQALDLSGLTFTAGISFTFTNGTVLGPGQYFLLGRNATALAAKYPGIVVNGVYQGKLDNAGETITLSHPYGAKIFSITYSPTAPWPAAANGFGFSLVRDPASPSHFRASSQPGGSPSASNPASTIPRICISEVLANPAPLDKDAIELYNPLNSPVSIGGWLLTDDPTKPWKYRIPAGTLIPAKGYLVFDESQFNAGTNTNSGFGLNSLGDAIYLFSADGDGNPTGYSHGFAFAGSAFGQSYGRYLNSAGEEQFPPQMATSLGTNNYGPTVGPIVISEIHYASTEAEPEFIELRNLTSATVNLFDPATLTNTWKLNGLGFDFPENTTLSAGACLLLTSHDPASFRTLYKVPASVAVFQYSKKLDNKGETLTLLCPATPEPSGIPYYAVDAIDYSPSAPWPKASTANLSLQRNDLGAYGNDPANWLAASPTPGVAPASLVPPIKLQLTFTGTNAHPVLAFEAAANRSYTLQWSPEISTTNWQSLLLAPIQPTNHVERFQDPTQATTRFYRVITPGVH